MKAIFVHANSILRDSHLDPAAPGEGWRLTPATQEALRQLSGPDQLLLVLGASSSDENGQGLDDDAGKTDTALVKQVEAAGGRVDGIISCPHDGERACKCWGDFPGVLWGPAAQFNLDLGACYVLADSIREVLTAYAAGVRPLVILGGRPISDVVGSAPMHKDFPIAPDLTTAVSYITVEQDISQRLGHARALVPAIPAEAVLYVQTDTMPTIKVTSARLAAMRNQIRESRLKLKDVARWLSFFILGALGVSLGIAYLLTHLYRVQPFPDFVWYVTLQFISRTERGVLFIVLGAGVIFLALRSLYRSDFYTKLRRRAKGGGV
jgi:D-glycero-D-manno-heptose 1,7-bisphosphate phosphatase